MEEHELRRAFLRRICANCSQSDDRVQPVMCNKSTQPSPTGDVGTVEEEQQQQPTDDGQERLARWSQECLLESKITDLQERLKDTEERYQSLKLQYETLSQVHRTLRENYNAMQEESEKMQFDIQHLTKCANVLR